MLIGLVLASGKGTRLAPLSNEKTPKQYLKLIDDKTLVENTVERIRNIIPDDNIFVVTNVLHKDLAYGAFPYLNKENIVLEPEMKETLASISHAVSYVSKIKGDDLTFLILPSDHYIPDIDIFHESVRKGEILERDNKTFILYGLKPYEPNTQYGYIKTENTNNLNTIVEFIEKPVLEIAEKIYKKDNYFWNNGIMLASKNSIFESIKKHSNLQYQLLEKFDKDLITTNDYFEKTLKASFSREILEKNKNMLLLDVSYTWYDIGNFDTLFKILEDLKLYDKLESIKQHIKQ